MKAKFERMQVLIEPDVRKEIEELAVSEAEGVTLRMIRTLLREALAARKKARVVQQSTLAGPRVDPAYALPFQPPSVFTDAKTSPGIIDV